MDENKWTARPYGDRWEIVNQTSAYCVLFESHLVAEHVADSFNRLETEAAALREAVRVLGNEVVYYRNTLKALPLKGYAKYVEASKGVDTNPIAFAAVKGGGQ